MKNNKSFTSLALILSLTLLIATTVSAAEYVSVTKDKVNIRATPSTKAAISSEVFAGFPLEVLKRDGQWAKVVDFEGDKGWIHTSLISKDKTVIVRKKDINLRQEPNTDKNTPVIATVKYGVVFTPLEKKGDWLRVRHDDTTEGWLSKSLVWPSDPLN
ncbi:MAG TPA: SH3 domain-containing protein [Desulfurivibrionaceae bacterium]|nr:SH3 domain-containing protein [Desulfurivibrionaceae bacterium]